MDEKQMAQLIISCAEAMDRVDGERLRAGERFMTPITGGPTVEGRKICQEICPDTWGELVYYLLAYTWNDALEWARQHKG